MKTLSVRLLGPAQVAVGRGAVHFTDDKRYQLLAYLAYKTTWVSREQLAYLFWSETETQAARRNLRHLLQRTRGLEWLAGLEAEEERLRWSVHSDVKDFLAALDKQEWERAMGCYQGTLLEGFTSEDYLEFSAWLEIEREQLKNHWHGAVLGHMKNLASDTQTTVKLEPQMQHERGAARQPALRVKDLTRGFLLLQHFALGGTVQRGTWLDVGFISVCELFPH